LGGLIFYSCSSPSTNSITQFQLTLSSSPTEGGSVDPANGEYVLGIPQVEKANIQLPDNKMFVIYGSSKSDSLSVELNEHKTLSTTILHQDIMMGGELRFIGH